MDGDDVQLLLADVGGVFVELAVTLWFRGGGAGVADVGDVGDGGYIVRNK